MAITKSAIMLLSYLFIAAASSSMQRNIDGYSHRVDERHSLIENIYWDARHASEAQRKLYQPRNASIDDGGLRRLFDLWTPDYNCPCLKERLGDIGDGGKWVCGARSLFKERRCVLYSIGSNGDSSFEEDMMRRASCEIHTFDPFIDPATKDAMRRKSGITFHDWGAGPETAKTAEGIQLKSMQDTMRELQHHWVDLLKIDIEGNEWQVLPSLLQDTGPGIRATQLLIELHYPLAVSEVQIWDTLDALTQDNFRLFSVEPNVHSGFATHYLEFSFIKVSPDGHLCVPRPASEGKVGLPLGCARQ